MDPWRIKKQQRQKVPRDQTAAKIIQTTPPEKSWHEEEYELTPVHKTKTSWGPEVSQTTAHEGN